MKPLELTLERWDFGEGYTGGRLYVDGMLFSDTIEPEDRGLSSVMPLAPSSNTERFTLISRYLERAKSK